MRKITIGLLALLALLAGGWTGAARVGANAQVQIIDDANVLSSTDENNIRAAAQAAPFGVTVWTTSGYPSQDAFASAVRAKVNNNIVVAVDPQNKWSRITTDTSTGLGDAPTQQALTAANAQFSKSQWAAGAIAAINTLAAAAPAQSNTNSGGTVTQPAPATSSGGGFNFLTCLIPILLLGAAAFFLRNRFGGQRAVAPPVAQYPQQGYPPQYPPQAGGYPPGYGPGYNQGGPGIGGAAAAGGLGALAGGVIGYEIGRNQGNQQAPDAGGGFGGFGGGGDVGDIGGIGGDVGGSFGDAGGGDAGGGFGGDAGGGFGGGDQSV